MARAVPPHGVGEAIRAVAPKSTGFAEFNKKVKTSQNNQSGDITRNKLALAELYEDEVK